MKEDILDLVFEEDEVTFQNNLGFKRGERRKTTDLWGKDRRVEYLNEYGGRNGYARARSGFGKGEYVEFYDNDGNVLGKAVVRDRAMGGREVIYTDNDGNVVHTRPVDEETVTKNNPMKLETTVSGGGSSGHFSGIGGSGGGGGGVGGLLGGSFMIIGSWVLIFLVLFVLGAVADLTAKPLGKLLENPQKVLRVLEIVLVHLSWILGTVFLYCKSRLAKAAPTGVKVWRIVMLLLAAAAMWRTGFAFQRPLFTGLEAISGWQGIKLYGLSLVPVVILVAVTSFLTLCTKKAKNSEYLRDVKICICRPAVIICMSMIFASRFGLNFVYRYTPDFADAMFFLFRGIGNLMIVGIIGSILCEITEG